jgi:putative ABC transport system permease protein
MLVAQKAVDNKIKSVKSSIGNTISISPAGFNPGSQANNALTTSQLDKVRSLPHVTSVAESLSDRLSTTGAAAYGFGSFGRSSDSQSSTTSLTSPVTLNQNSGRRFFAGGGNSGATTSFSLPISFLGTNTPGNVNDTALTIKSGHAISGTSDTNSAMVSQTMAAKNNLTVGSTFSAYGATLTVAGIFASSNQGANGTVVMSLPALQRLSAQSGALTSATASVDSLDNLSSVTASIKSTLGSSADVTSAQQQADNSVQPLNSVKTVSTFSLIGAVIAGAVIILLTMVMVVRERKKEIGVVKAIGGSNWRIISEFMVESLTLAILGTAVGLLIGVVGGQPITKMLVNSSANTTSSQGFAARSSDTQGRRGFQPGGGFGGRIGQRVRSNSAVRSLSNIKAQIGPSILLEGFGAAVLIAVLGSALAAGMISKVRPSTVMRTE